MPTTTVYANKMAQIRVSALHAVYPTDGWEVSIASLSRYAVVGFDVPDYLYGKQVTDGYIVFEKDQFAHVYAAYLNIRSPKDFKLEDMTYDYCVRHRGYLTLAMADPNDRQQKQNYAGFVPGGMAKLVNGAIFEVLDTGRLLSATLRGRPSITITYTDNPVPIIAKQYIGKYVNPHRGTDIVYDIFNDIIGPIDLTALKLIWRRSGENVTNEIDLDPSGYYFPNKGDELHGTAIIPSGTFPIHSEIDYQIQVQINGKWWSNNTAWETRSTVDSLSASAPIAPVNVTFDVESELEFSWTHVIATGSDPTGYDIQYSTNGSTWIDLKSDHQTGDTSCIIPANSLPAGKLWWRVRTYNGDYLPGAWSDPANIVGYGAPPAPVISSVTTGARPTIRWQSETQVAYALVIKQDNTQILTVNETASTDKYYTVRDYLADGSYTVRVRIKNAGAYWSSWAEQDFRVQTQKPVAPTLTAEPIKNGIQFCADMGSEAATVYLLRDGVPIGLMDSGGYRDYGAVGPHTYTARRIGDDDSFADSKPLLAVTEVRQAVIAPADDLGSMVGPLLQVESNTYPSSVTNGAALVHYAGRRYPVAVTTDAIAEEYNPAFAAHGLAQYNALYAYMLDGRTVLYRNSTGDCAYCIITEMSPTKSYRGVTQWQMTLARVDYIDGIDYRVGGVDGPSTGRLYR